MQRHRLNIDPTSPRPPRSARIGAWARLGGLVLFALTICVGCEKAPYDELQAAEAAVREARQLRAPLYAPEAFGALESKLESAKEEIEAQYKQSEFRRNYGRARGLLTEAIADADRIIGEAEQRKQEAKAVALQEREQAKEAVQEVRQLLERAEQTTSTPGVVPDELKAEADELHRTLAEVQTAIDANNHLVARQKAKAVQEKSQQLQNEVQDSTRPERR